MFFACTEIASPKLDYLLSGLSQKVSPNRINIILNAHPSSIYTPHQLPFRQHAFPRKALRSQVGDLLYGPCGILSIRCAFTIRRASAEQCILPTACYPPSAKECDQVDSRLRRNPAANTGTSASPNIRAP